MIFYTVQYYRREVCKFLLIGPSPNRRERRARARISQLNAGVSAWKNIPRGVADRDCTQTIVQED